MMSLNIEQGTVTRPRLQRGCQVYAFATHHEHHVI